MIGMPSHSPSTATSAAEVAVAKGLALSKGKASHSLSPELSRQRTLDKRI